ncbi:hypothetical protein KCV87_02215 [Actinosynnema pretiosum subsp. pretiosum]|uniref:SnoaL-like domain-containing protein n=1 Tax=Actinosynnema pretiosum subsp. pretiosum TaxID=103721 RepID=A0AA45R4I4_9PSEU|nr:hypothetical protein APASM_3569 [Actinosynnema pretiosum subsp. pretiosum]QUF04967.1 hypothetical protein KCV87_02215 [Actinosynnema pretiosum subsp. pretiosum]
MVLDERRPAPHSDVVTAAGVDHVRLSYLYADEGDLEGLESLLHLDPQVGAPPEVAHGGRPEVLQVLAPVGAAPGRHLLSRVIAEGDCVAAVGRLTTARAEVEFADIFTIGPDGLLAGCRRFYSATSP